MVAIEIILQNLIYYVEKNYKQSYKNWKHIIFINTELWFLYTFCGLFLSHFLNRGAVKDLIDRRP